MRGLPSPVADRGGWRVDTALPDEVRRYVFAAPGLQITAVALAEHRPRVFVKLCGSQATLRALLPAAWQLQPPATMMTRGVTFESPAPLPDGFRLRLATAGPVTSAKVVTADGTTAAAGHACELDGVFIYDRIVTHAAHRRRGLGTALMSALAAARRSPAAREILVATADGRALYQRIGWSDYSPYSTAAIPAPDSAMPTTTTRMTP